MNRKPLIQITIEPAIREAIDELTPDGPDQIGRRLRRFLDLVKAPAVRNALRVEAFRRGWAEKEP